MVEERDKPRVTIDRSKITQTGDFTYLQIAAKKGGEKRFPEACATCLAGSSNGVVFDHRNRGTVAVCWKISETPRITSGYNLGPGESVFVVRAPIEKVTPGLLAAAMSRMNCQITNLNVLLQE